MRKFLLAVVFLGVTALSLSAQDATKMEIFGGYQFLHAGNFDGEGDGANTIGWNAAATFNFMKHVGITADFSGNYRTKNIVENAIAYPASVRIYTYTFGPVVSLNLGRQMRVFTHALFGEGHVRPTGCIIFSGSPDECGSGAASGFAMMLGGGVDAMASNPIAVRVFQADWVYLPSQFGLVRKAEM
jgi:hypothetical protein